jgi:hypothetical protein
MAPPGGAPSPGGWIMTIVLNCDGCGTRLQAGDNVAGRPVRCPRCGRVFAAPPADPPESPAEPLGVYGVQEDPEPPTVLPATKVPRPSAVPQVPLEAACPKCGAPLKPEAVVCVDCGFNRKTGKQLRTVSRRLEAHWYRRGPSYLVRLLVLALMLLVGAAVAVALLEDPDVPPVALIVPMAWALVWVLLLGIMERTCVTRTAEGGAVLVRRQWVGFVPTGRTTLDLEPYTTIRPRTEPAGLDAQMVLGVLLLFLLCGVPGLVYLAIRLAVASPTWFVLELSGTADEYGLEEVLRRVVFRGPSEATMRRAGDALEQIAGMRYG